MGECGFLPFCICVQSQRILGASLRYIQIDRCLLSNVPMVWVLNWMNWERNNEIKQPANKDNGINWLDVSGLVYLKRLLFSAISYNVLNAGMIRTGCWTIRIFKLIASVVKGPFYHKTWWVFINLRVSLLIPSNAIDVHKQTHSSFNAKKYTRAQIMESQWTSMNFIQIIQFHFIRSDFSMVSP